MLETNNRNDGAGRLVDGEEALLVRAEGAIATVDDVRAIVLHSEAGDVVRVADVAEVRIGGLTRYGAVTRTARAKRCRGWCSVCAAPTPRPSCPGSRRRLAEIAPTLPAGITIDAFYDRSNLVERAVGTVSKALLEAIVLVRPAAAASSATCGPPWSSP